MIDKHSFGKELIIDMHHCNNELFNRKDILKYFGDLCELIEMVPCKIAFWDYHYWPNWLIKIMQWDKEDKIFGTSAIQFIRTSNITIHTIVNLRLVYINVFSCKDFDSEKVLEFTTNYFGGATVNSQTIERR